MADSSDSQGSVATESEIALSRRQIEEMKRDLEGWRETLVRLRGFFLWERPYYPGIIFGITTLLFVLIWYLDPSVITTFALLGLLITCFDCAVPFIGPRFFSDRPWTVTQELQFEEICERILHVTTDISDFFHGMAVLKEERPEMYFLLVMGALSFFAWIGYVMNNLFLTYLLVLAIVMFPGMRETGMVQRYLHKYWIFLKRKLFGRVQVLKTKTN